MPLSDEVSDIQSRAERRERAAACTGTHFDLEKAVCALKYRAAEVQNHCEDSIGHLHVIQRQ